MPEPQQSTSQAAHGFLDGSFGQHEAWAANAQYAIEEALALISGQEFDKLSKEDRATLIAKIRHLLLKCDRRIVCPECREPSLPYFLPHTSRGTVQLQHKHAKSSAHVIYGSRGGKLAFPELPLVRVEASDAEK